MVKRHKKAPSSNNSAYCQARKRLPLEYLKLIGQHVVNAMNINIREADLWFGRQVLVVDGTGLMMPDTVPNQQLYPQSSESQPGCGFPALKMVGLFSLCSGAMLGYSLGNKHSSEHRLWLSLKNLMLCGDILLADRGFCSFLSFGLLSAEGVDCVMRLREGRGERRFQVIRKLSDGSTLVKWPKPASRPKNIDLEIWKQMPEFLEVRLIEVKLEFDGFRTTQITLITTMLDHAAYTADELGKLYLKRWKVEVFFREIKTVMGMDFLSCKTPDLSHKELEMYAIAHNLLRALIQCAAKMFDSAIDKISFKGTLQQLNEWLWLFTETASPERLRELKQEFYRKLVDAPLIIRPFRTEPRAKNRRPKQVVLLNKRRSEMQILHHRGKQERMYAFNP